MAAIQVSTAGNNYNTSNGNRVVVRTSAGIPYVVVVDATEASIKVFKGNSTTPTSFSEQDTADNPDATTYGSMSAAIDSTGVIHIVFVEYISKSDDLEYITFDTGTDQWGTIATINSDLGAESTSVANLYTSIAIDSNDIPHIAYTGVEANAGTVGWVVRYNNRIGGAWNGTGVEVEGQTGNKDCLRPSITIDADDNPYIAYVNEDDDDVGVATGDANDATSFSLFDVETDNETTSGQNGVSVAVDSSGNHYVSYRDESDTFIYINKHNHDAPWTTWQARQTNSNNGINPSLVVDGVDVYVFYEDDVTNDIVYDKYSGVWGSGTWLGEVVLEAGTFNTVKTKWAFWVDNHSEGALVTVDRDQDISNDGSNIDFTATRNGESQSFQPAISGDLISAAFLLAIGDGSPTGAMTVKLYNTTGTHGTTAKPMGTALATADTIDASILTSTLTWVYFTFPTPYSVTSGTTYAITIEKVGTGINYISAGTDSSASHGGNRAELQNTTWTAVIVDLNFKITIYNRSSSAELDYIFADETASPDIWWNSLGLVGAATYPSATYPSSVGGWF